MHQPATRVIRLVGDDHPRVARHLCNVAPDGVVEFELRHVRRAVEGAASDAEDSFLSSLLSVIHAHKLQDMTETEKLTAYHAHANE